MITYKMMMMQPQSSQGPPTQTTINSLTIASITAGPVQPQPNASFSGEETLPMLRHALAAAPNPSSFIQTPQHDPDNNLSWDIDNDTDAPIDMYYIFRESFQCNPEQFLLFDQFDLL